MFERRLKIFLLILCLFTVALMLRAAQVQVVQRDNWLQRAAGLLETVQTTETTRGRILDCEQTPQVLAEDVPCTDACVDYRAIIDPADPKWIAGIVSARLKIRLGNDFKRMPAEKQKEEKQNETARVMRDIDAMWDALAGRYRTADEEEVDDPRAAIEEIRQHIAQKVASQRRWIWYRTFQINQTKTADLPRWQRWLAGTSKDGPDMGDFGVDVDGERQPHVILHALSPEAITWLGTRLEQFPGLALRPSTRRTYPLKEVACHVLGRLGRVSAEDLEQAKAQQMEVTRRYLPNDPIGRDGIESLCEPLLRGARGQIARHVGDEALIKEIPYVPGNDVSITIDASLQHEVQAMLKHVRIWSEVTFEPITPAPGLNMHAAAVVIDVKTSEVRVLASNPDFDVNEVDQKYSAMAADRLNDPMRDRATSDAFEPGSTVKPMIGLAAITQGVIGPVQGIECTGYLILPVNGPDGRPTGQKIREPIGRCWVASEYSLDELRAHGIMSYAHHPIPVPHRGHDNNPDGWLSYRDALERSCNVFFETTADRLGPAAVAHWYDAFGFGRLTGIGIPEFPGLRPGQRRVLSVMDRMNNCFAGIGQVEVLATPLQIANEAATIARDGIWMRPRLLSSQMQAELDAASLAPVNRPPDRVDLHLDPEGLRQAKMGMINVINGAAGTGRIPQRDDMEVAGKTGSAQGARIWTIVTDQNGKPMTDPTGRVIREPLPPVSKSNPTSDTPWYRSSDPEGKKIEHAWFMGFAPAQHPEIAFCVLIEYAGSSGDPAAGPVVKQLLEACVNHGYLHPNGGAVPLASAR